MDGALPSRAVPSLMVANGLPIILLQKSKICFTTHAIRLGFPPHIVANWTGRTLSV